MKPAKNWFEALMSHDRRKAKRRESPAVIAFYWNGGSPVAHPVRDISSTGFYLVTPQRWYPGTVVTMTLQRTGNAHAGSELSISVQARVVRSGADGSGLAFVLPDDPRQTGRLPQGRLGQVAADKKTLARFLSPLRVN